MNFLAHLHIADHCQSSLLGNLLGDFVKGDPSKQFDEEIAAGIRLHRFVDSFTDAHSIIKDVKPLFSTEQRRFAPIALDMFWDHCLAKHWHSHHTLSLRQFVVLAESNIRHFKGPLPRRFNQVTDHMWQGRWLESYADFDNIVYALERMSQRRLRMGSLAKCSDSLDRHYGELEQQFLPLYQDVLKQALKASQ
ncbi:ACP phosphodiesterase [Vibrio agarivorans]|uniref:ACP phosphodiesterase n=1 Tax=Vibrio agarivorans TaxID=153622 RepID=A0ABT7Y5Q5_9VIBR|nr:ACP phosphodiesterase [Vibrio agarivorans]MDN2483388.1 ACP phosphodiesterase [Vibrio agarivorans]